MSTPGSPINQGNPNPAFQQANQPLQGPPPPDPQAMPEQMPSTQATAGATGPAQQPNVQGPSPWSKVLHTLLGTHESFVQTPNGPVAQQAENRPGQLFRSILAGALLGGATAGENAASPGAGSGWVAAGRGMGAAAKGQQEQEQNQQKQAQQQFQNQQEVTKDQREQTLMNAQIANMQSETAARQHQSDYLDQQQHDAHNKASAALYGALQEAGGVAPIDGKLPESLTAYDFAQRYAKDPSIRQPPINPDGSRSYTRHFIDKTDSSEVQWNGTNWTHPDGTPADMTDKTSIQVLDVPVDAMRQKRPMKGSEINEISGQNLVDPDKTYTSLAPIDLIGLNKTRLADENEAAKTKHEGMMAAAQAKIAANEAERLARDGYNAAREQVVQENKDLEDRVKENIDPTSPAVTQAQARIDANNERLRQLYEQTFPGQKLPPKTALPPEVIAHPEVVSIITNELPNFNPAIAKKIGNMNPDEVETQLKSATTIPLEVKNKILKSVGKPPMKEDQVTLPGIVRGAVKTGEENLGKIKTFFTGN